MKHICKYKRNNVNYEEPKMEAMLLDCPDVITMSEGKDDTLAGEQLGWDDF